MALSFKDTKGKAAKGVETYTYVDGDNRVRLVGGVLPRYVYWLKGSNNKDIPVECLSFDRNAEKFTNKEYDPVPEYFPEKKCTWSYVINCIDPKDGKVKALNLKKKLFEQILNAAEDLGDPTDPDTGWDIVFKKQKTGALAYNVDYTLQVLRCKNRALTAEERKAAEEAESVDAKFPRPTSEEVKNLLMRIKNDTNSDVDEATTAEREAVSELS